MMYYFMKNLANRKNGFRPYLILLSLLMLMTGVLSMLNENMEAGLQDKSCTCNKPKEDLFFNQLLILKFN